MGILVFNNYNSNKEQKEETTERPYVVDKTFPAISRPLYSVVGIQIAVSIATNSFTLQQEYESAFGGNRGYCVPSLWPLWYFKAYQNKLAALIT
jgi:hypothetical protein